MKILFAAALVMSTAVADDLSIAREALRDGLWEVARTHAAKVEGDDARLVVLESLAGEGKWAEIGVLLGGMKDAKGAGFDYYRAVVKGDHAAARAALKAGGSAAGLVEAQLQEADMLAKAGKQSEATTIWREIAANTNRSERALAYASVNLMDEQILRRAFETMQSSDLRKMVGLRLGMALLRSSATLAEGESVVRTIVRDSPDAVGAREAFLAVADAKIVGRQWKAAVDAYREAVEIWPDADRMSSVHEGRGWALQQQGRKEEALEAFRHAAMFAVNDTERAIAGTKEGDVLADMGRAAEAMEKYREVVAKYPATTEAEKLKSVIRLREREDEGRRLYREFRYRDAMQIFNEIAESDSSRRQRMKYFALLCLYGQGQDDEAAARARELAAECPDAAVRADAVIWLAKLLYNRREWKESGGLFEAYSDMSQISADAAAEALLWAARAASADNDFNLAIQRTTRLFDRYPDSPLQPDALIAQGEALVELARFDEAVLVFERVVAAATATAETRALARLKKADALYAMGADNPARYTEALSAYRAVRFSGRFQGSERLVVAFKIARALERLKRMDEAIDQYYSQVVIAYREGRLRGEKFNDDARAAFSRAAFRLADEYESRGRDRQAQLVLRLVAESDVPAAEAAKLRIDKISNKGRFLK